MLKRPGRSDWVTTSEFSMKDGEEFENGSTLTWEHPITRTRRLLLVELQLHTTQPQRIRNHAHRTEAHRRCRDHRAQQNTGERI
jgi:hypothetical protein